jgi:phosphoglycolate phosphatase
VVTQVQGFASDVLFDLDGTLIDSAPAILATLRLVLDRHGIEPVIPVDRRLIGAPLIPMLTRLTGITHEEELAPLAATFRTAYDEVGLTATVAYDGLGEVLESMARRGHRLYVVTNKRDLPTRRILALLGIAQRFAAVYALDTMAPPAREKGELVGTLLAAHQLDASSCVMVGDTVEDAAAAYANGIAFMAATYGYGTPSVDAPTAALGTIASLRELPERLEQAAPRRPPSNVR